MAHLDTAALAPDRRAFLKTLGAATVALDTVFNDPTRVARRTASSIGGTR